MKAWLLVVLFSTTDDAKVAVFETEKECKAKMETTVKAIGKHPDVTAIFCEQGDLKEEK